MTSRRFLATAAALVLTAVFTTPRSLAGTEGIFTYEVVGDSVTIGWCDREATGSIAVPPLIEEKPVTTIGPSAFNGCGKITSITLPVGVTTVENYAFMGCSTLAEIRLPEGLLHLGTSSLSHCPLLKTIHIPSTLATSRGPFEEGTFLQSATFAPGATQVADGLFYSCTKLKGLKIPSTVTRIGAGAFLNCTGLTQLRLPAGLKEIGYGAFDTCSSLENLPIPASVTTIGVEAFARSALRDVTLPAGLQTLGQAAFFDCPQLERVNLPKNIKKIPGRLFARCKSLKTITIPSSVTRIGAEAFCECGLDIVAIPSKVREIGKEAFYRSYDLKSAIFAGEAPALGKRAFSSTSGDFTIFLEEDATGFTLPRWNGYPTSPPRPEISPIVSRNFAPGIIGKKDSYRNFTFLNSGIRPLTNLTATIKGGNSGDFIIKPLKKTSLAPGEAITVRVRFSPLEAGRRRSQLSIGSNDDNENPLLLTLQATGLREN